MLILSFLVNTQYVFENSHINTGAQPIGDRFDYIRESGSIGIKSFA